MNIDEKYIRECIELASLAEGMVSPNPLVGAVVLDVNGHVVGRGHHIKCGEAHAEVCALNEAGEKAIGGTLYVNLEPCSHFGKTPPCADRVVKSGIKRLVIGMVDPNPLVAGRGFEKCRNAGIEVVSGVLEKECKKLNEVFIKHISKKQPFIALKTASTIDGKIATRTGSSKWITSEAARGEVQRLRNKYDAILTGSGTVIADNPSLTCRMESKTCKNPVRIIVDSELKTSPDSKVYLNDGVKVIVAVAENIPTVKIAKFPENVEFIKCPLNKDSKIELKFLVDKLYKSGLTSILVEAGGLLNGALIKNSLVDKFYFFIAHKILGDNAGKSLIDGFEAEDINGSLNLKFAEIKSFSPDLMIEAYI